MLNQAQIKIQLQDLSKTLVEAKRQFAVQCRPAIAVAFLSFLDAYPEIESLSFEVRTDIYDDQEYSEGIEEPRYALRPDLVPEGSDLVDGGMHEGPLSPVGSWTLRTAAGKHETWALGHYKPDKLAEMQREAQGELDERAVIVERIGSARYAELCDAVQQMLHHVEGLDVDFAKVVFGENVRVKATRDGLTSTGDE